MTQYLGCSKLSPILYNLNEIYYLFRQLKAKIRKKIYLIPTTGKKLLQYDDMNQREIKNKVTFSMI